jgi:hypothetical protein
MIPTLYSDLNFPVTRQLKSVHRKNRINEIFIIFLFLYILLLIPQNVKAQNPGDDYEEISVFLMVQGNGGYEITAIYKNEQVYLPVSEMFRCLKINQTVSEFNDTISGFYLTENNKYIISMDSHTVFIDGKMVQLTENEMLSTEALGIALKIDQYGKIFGLDCRFNFNSLSVELKTSHELPVIKELRLEQMRKNISRLRGEVTVDTTYARKYHVFRGFMADWAVYSTQLVGGAAETRTSLGIGTEFLGGETDIELNYSTRTQFDKRQQQYHWRWANNNSNIVKQVVVGKISSRSIASIYSPLIGTIVTNTPTSYRRSFGTYTMSDFTEPGWTVELYINNVIVDFTTSDASGFYKFDIPLVYGASIVLVKFYGPWGEERQKEQIINVPFNFLPKGEMQYSISGAMLQDTSHNVFTHTEVSVGISRHLTLGGGYEYLSSIQSSPSIPFVNGSAQLFSNILINGEYAYGVRTKALLSYSLPSNFVFDIDYTKYAFEQKAITFNYLEERKIRISLPISIRKFKAYSRLSYSQNVLKETKYSTMEATISTFFRGVSANFTGNANWLGNYDKYIYGNLALGFRFFKTLSFRPQAQYDFSNNKLITTKVELENNFSPKTNLSLTWENNFRSNFNTIELTFRYDFSFAQISLNTRFSNNAIITGQSARGSLATGSGNGHAIFDRRSQVGRAGLTVIPFLDINNNDHRDNNEPITSGMSIRINGGRILPDSKDSIIRIMDLEPYASYMLEFSDTQFDNIAWQIQNKAISIMMDPNQFKLLEIPIKVMGEINGMVYMKTGTRLKAQSRIVINIFTENGILIAKTQSESDGYFSYIGLAPGKYYAEIDMAQLSRLKAVSNQERFEFEIRPTENGDIIENIEFQLTKDKNETQGELIQDKKVETPESVSQDKIPTQPSPEKVQKTDKNALPAAGQKETKAAVQEKQPTDKKDKINPDLPKPLPETANKVVKPALDQNNALVSGKSANDTIDPASNSGKYYIQVGAWKSENSAQKFADQLSAVSAKKWFLAYEDSFYKVRLGYFTSQSEANRIVESLKSTNQKFYINKMK